VLVVVLVVVVEAVVNVRPQNGKCHAQNSKCQAQDGKFQPQHGRHDAKPWQTSGAT